MGVERSGRAFVPTFVVVIALATTLTVSSAAADVSAATLGDLSHAARSRADPRTEGADAGLASALAAEAEASPLAVPPPVATPDIASTLKDTPVDVDVLANDSDPTAATLTLVSVTQPPSGAASIVVPNGARPNVRYTPSVGFLGVVVFTYTIRNGSGLEATASVTVTVNASLPAVTVRSASAWTVTVFAEVVGTAPPGAAVTVAVTGPRTVLRLRAVANDSGQWRTRVQPAWPGRFSLVASAPDASPSPLVVSTAYARYLASISGPLSRSDVPTSWRAGCPVPPSSLRRLRITYWNWVGQVAIGQVVAHAARIGSVRNVFAAAFAARFPFRSVRPVDVYYRGRPGDGRASDVRSMQADNTSAFNCRQVTGRPKRISPHAYGTAIDINPRENPYLLTRRKFYPTSGKSFLKRQPYRKGMLTRRSPVVRAAAAARWRWGTRFVNPDYQHFDLR